MRRARRGARAVSGGLVLVLVLALVASACSRGQDRVVVGAVYPLSGSQGPGGLQEYRGAQIAVDLVNADGGVDGRQIELRAIDVPGSDAVPSAISSLKRDGVQVVIGSYGSTISRPAEAMAARNGMLFWETGAVGEMTRVGAGRLVFRVAPSGRQLGRSAVAFVARRLAPMLDKDPGSLRFAVTGVDDPYGRAVSGGAVAEIERLGLHDAGLFPYDAQTLDASSLVRRIAAARPDVLFVAAYLQDGVAIRKAIVSQHVPLVANIGSSSSYCMPAFGAALGPQAVGVFASDKPDAEYLDQAGLSGEARDVLRQAARMYEDRFGEEMEAPALAGFAAAWALFHWVMPRASAMTPDAVAAAARGMHLGIGELPNGSGLAFGAPGSRQAGTNLNASSVIWEWTGVDHRVVVWPPRFARSSIQAIPLGT
ncbi:MAG: ABC transporter substrate-binding protein [Actinomycetota bacterium]|nr:ABC transporter substrate-binding protein [Actinomycetota bacterium]